MFTKNECLIIYACAKLIQSDELRPLLQEALTEAGVPSQDLEGQLEAIKAKCEINLKFGTIPSQFAGGFAANVQGNQFGGTINNVKS